MNNNNNNSNLINDSHPMNLDPGVIGNAVVNSNGSNLNCLSSNNNNGNHHHNIGIGESMLASFSSSIAPTDSQPHDHRNGKK